MRLSYVPPTPSPSDPSAAAAYAQLSARRSPKPLQPLDLTLLHSPPVASSWSSFLGTIRAQTSLPTDIRELCICRVAVLNEAAYEWAHHVPILKGEGKVSDEAVEEVETRKSWKGWGEPNGENQEDGQESGGGWSLNERQRAVFAYTDAMTVGIKVPEEIFQWAKRLFSEREVVEITSTVAAYNCVSRFLVALDVGEASTKGASYHGIIS